MGIDGRPDHRPCVKEAAAAGASGPSARRVLDADGLALAPGFIDMHAHSDLALLRDPDHSAKAAQGVTLEVIGQDGLSYAPVDDRTLAEVRRAITGWNGNGDDIDFNWRSVGEYLDRLDHGFDGEGIAVNAAYLIPQGTVRMLAVGWDDREATPQELDRMRQLVADGHAGGRRRHVLRADLHPRHVRQGRRTHRTVPGGGRVRRLLLPAPPLVRRGRPGRRTRRWWPSPARPAARSTSPTPP